MILDTNDLLYQAKRNSTRVSVYLRETGDLEVVGIILDYTDEAISVLDCSIDQRISFGIVNFLRENVDVITGDEVQ